MAARMHSPATCLPICTLPPAVQLRQQLDEQRSEQEQQHTLLQGWQAELDARQQELAGLEAMAADTLADAQQAAAAALQKRDQVRGAGAGRLGAGLGLRRVQPAQGPAGSLVRRQPHY